MANVQLTMYINEILRSPSPWAIAQSLVAISPCTWLFSLNSLPSSCSKHLLPRFMLCLCLLLRLSTLSELNYWMKINKQKQYINYTMSSPFFRMRMMPINYLFACSRAPHYNPLLWEGTTDYIQLPYLISSDSFLYLWVVFYEVQFGEERFCCQ
jgi:hypothetical protein